MSVNARLNKIRVKSFILISIYKKHPTSKYSEKNFLEFNFCRRSFQTVACIQRYDSLNENSYPREQDKNFIKYPPRKALARCNFIHDSTN